MVVVVTPDFPALKSTYSFFEYLRETNSRVASVPVTSVAFALLQPSRRRSVFSSSEPPAVVSTTSTEKPAAVTPSRCSSSASRLRTVASARSKPWSAR